MRRTWRFSFFGTATPLRHRENIRLDRRRTFKLNTEKFALKRKIGVFSDLLNGLIRVGALDGVFKQLPGQRIHPNLMRAAAFGFDVEGVAQP